MRFLSIKSFILTGSAFVTILFWEHFARIKDVEFRPTIGINLVTNYFVKCWKWLGKMFAIISSYFHIFVDLYDYIVDHLGKFIKSIIEFLQLDEMWNSFTGLFESLWNFCFSFVSFFGGYFEAVGNHKTPLLIVLGSFVLICFVWFLIVKRKYLWSKIKSFF